MKSVILAAGSGSRFKNQGVSLPKPLIRLGGLTLLERTVFSAAKAGVTEFVIVSGDYLDQIRDALRSRFKDLKVQWVHNKDWEAGNGTTLLAARPYLEMEDRFLVLMCDHLLFFNTLAGLIGSPSNGKSCTMAVDRKTGLLADVSDATKVRLTDGRITEIGKNLDPFDGVDIGAAVCTPQVFQELADVRSTNGGRCFHTDAMKMLARKGLLRFHDIKSDVWEDVDDIQALGSAKKVLYGSLRKPTDGFLSRHLERYLSLSITRLLADTPVKPNHVTFFIVMLGALAATLFTQPSYWYQVSAALVFWFSSFLDGCDGELARLKFMETRLGGWLDLWSDNLVHIMVFGGIGVGLFRNTGDIQWIYLGIIAMVGVLLSVSWVSWKTLRKRKERGGPLFVSVADESSAEHAGKSTGRLVRIANALSRRDFIFFLIFLTMLGWQPVFLWMAAVGSILYFLTLVFIEWKIKHSNA